MAIRQKQDQYVCLQIGRRYAVTRFLFVVIKNIELVSNHLCE